MENIKNFQLNDANINNLHYLSSLKIHIPEAIFIDILKLNTSRGGENN